MLHATSLQNPAAATCANINITSYIIQCVSKGWSGGGAKRSLANEADFNDILKFKIATPADNT